MNDSYWLDPGPLIDDDLELVLVKRVEADPAKAYVPAYEFEMRATGRPEKIGRISLRIGDDPRLCMYAGNIGYAVNEEHRGRRYAARACRLVSPLARRHGLTELWITCDPDNVASRRTCELAGAAFIEVVDVPQDHEMYAEGARQKCRYRLALE